MAIGYLAYIAIDMDASTLTEIYRGLPRGMLYVTDGGRVINPITVAEWVYFALAVLVLAAYSVAAMWPARALAPLSDVARRP
jgi:hypothetical protein